MNGNSKTHNDIHFGIIKKVVTKNKKFFIHNTTLQPYLSLVSFDYFIRDNDLMVVRLDNEFSVIKKSIL
jgi:hypothetical protein